MGRQSPGKWIRNLLLGKKSSSKSNSSKKEDIFKPSSNKDVLVVSSEASMSSPTVTPPPTSGASATKGVVSENQAVRRSSNDRVILSIEDEQANAQDVANIGSEDHLDKTRLIEAAIIAQAAFRGYQARRTFRILKGVIPLQALIRGQLVRREAVSALYYVKGIVKFQALARGYKVRHSGIGLEVQKIFKDTKRSNSNGVVTSTKAEKLSDNVFVHKLLASSPYPVSLCLKYDYGEPNLAWEWLERWTRSHFWAPLPELKKLDSVSDEKNGCCQAVENNEGQVKRNAQKAPAVRVDDGSISNPNRHIRRLKKESNIPLHSAKEHSQKENEKSITKKSRMQNGSDRPEVANEKRKHVTRTSSDHTVTDVSQHCKSASLEKMKDLAVSKSKDSDLEKTLGHQAEVKHDNNVSHNDSIAVLESSFANGKDGRVIEDLNGDGDNCISSNENHKNFQRRASLPANFINHNNELQNTPRLPSYMAPTESAKAKLRGQGSPRFASELVDKIIINRRLSLSSSLNGKLGLLSPRSERLVNMSSKGVINTDRSLSSSRDWTDKLIQPRWRR